MNAALGLAGVTLGFVISLAAIAVIGAGLRKKRAMLIATSGPFSVALLGASLLAVVAMERALLTDDFSLVFVAENSARSTPFLFKFATMWAALEGSILLWGLVLAGFIAAMAYRFRRQVSDPLMGWALLTAFVVAAFFFALMIWPANPFQTVAGKIPTDGPGPNPLLQNHVLMAFHPPMLYLGYVGFTVPFAFAIGALVTGRLDEGWLAVSRRWTLFAWGFLTFGIVLGSWWSYEVLGWGGFWAWDPVENASFLPWLTGTAYLHSVLVQERRGMLRVWNLSLLVATFALTILGTFLTRSGVLDSVHAFTEEGPGQWILAFFGVICVVSVGLIGWRGDRLRSPGSIDSPISREGAFLANNVLFAGFAFVVLLGTVFPLIVEAINGSRISVGRPYFDRMTAPIGLTLLFLMAIAPVLPWRKASTELLRTRLHWPAWFATAALVVAVAVGARGLAPLLAFFLGGFAAGAAFRQLFLAARRQGWRGLVGRANGGMIVHLGVIMIAIGFASATAYGERAEARLAPGESATLAGHRITYVGRDIVQYPNRRAIEAKVRIDGGQIYRPTLSTYPFVGQAIGTPSVRTGITEDVYLTLIDAPRNAEDAAVIGVARQPMVVWLWIGGGTMALGTLLSAVPGRRRRRPTDPVSAPVDADAHGDQPREAALVP
ncbi:MAG TPA: heme lyase CcmF/NrfE family subunit [Acidimicrobiales bacterium]|nr:heme lyase CcmF/NrfE family subunit [Acidimicrobiales bacterium]